jgi:RNA polymerase sigma-70 factor (ECF subfamily)
MGVSKVNINIIVEEVKNGNSASFSTLYDMYSESIYGLIFKIVKVEDVASDIMQDTFIKVWQNIQKFDASKGSIFTWILNIARNASIDYLRRNNKMVSGEIQEEHLNVSILNNIDNQININHIGLKDAVKTLSIDHQFVIEYQYYYGYTQQELSEEFEIPLGTIKTRTRNALNLLRNIFTNFIFWILINT